MSLTYKKFFENSAFIVSSKIAYGAILKKVTWPGWGSKSQHLNLQSDPLSTALLGLAVCMSFELGYHNNRVTKRPLL